jgi:hypothetical protein
MGVVLAGTQPVARECQDPIVAEAEAEAVACLGCAREGLPMHTPAAGRPGDGMAGAVPQNCQNCDG